MAIRGNKFSHDLKQEPAFGINPRLAQTPQTIRLNFHKIEDTDDPKALLEQLHQDLKKSTLPSVVKIGLVGCSPCITAQESLEEIVMSSQGLNLITINLDALSDSDREIFMENFQVEGKKPGLPTIRFFSPGSTQAITEKHLVSNAWMGKDRLERVIKDYLPGALRAAQANIHQA